MIMPPPPFQTPNPFSTRVVRAHHNNLPAPVEGVEQCPEDRQRRREIEEAMLKNLRLEGLSRFVSAMSQLRPTWTSEDPALRTQVEEQLQNMAFGASTTTPLPISSVAQDIGIALQHEQLIKVGAIVARLYREKHHTEPPKKPSLHGGDMERRVNAYTETDRDLIVAALNLFFAGERTD